MQNQAASAALSGHEPAEPILDHDGKLSSASAATSLKYAKAQDLPSFPSTGGVKLSAAGAAASLATSNTKSFEYWKPEPIPAANRAALLAKDHKMDALWQPEASAAGSRAAMFAAAHPTEVEPMQSRKVTTNMPSAAYDTPGDTHKKALMAANAASSHSRQRSGSMPMQPAAKPSDSTSWALKAATKSHKDGVPPASGAFTTGDPGFEAARIQNVAKGSINRQMYTSAPPVAIEVQEKNRQDTLRASAVAMAQKMYAIQQRHIDEAAGKHDNNALAASRSRTSGIPGSSTGVGDGYTTTGNSYEGLEEAARKLAQERLSKIHDGRDEYRDYYGQTSPGRSRLSTRSRRRASSVTGDDSDEEQSRRIKSQMSIFQSKVVEVDKKKRQEDRDNLLQLAHRNVDAQIRKMDDKVFQETGKASPAQMEHWEKSAREKAQRDSDERMKYAGKVHIGGGKYLEQSELEAIARARLQPTLDEIYDKAEKQRARDEEERLERERKQEQANREKTRAAETAALVRAEKEKERNVLREEKMAEKERVRLEKEENRKTKDTKPSRMSNLLGRGTATTEGGEVASTAVTEPASEVAPTTTTTEPATATTATTETASATDAPTTLEVVDGQTFHDSVTSPTEGSELPVVLKAEPDTTVSPDTELAKTLEKRSIEVREPTENRDTLDNSAASPPASRVKSWMNVRFRSKSNAQKDVASVPAVRDTKLVSEEGKTVNENGQAPRTDSMRDVAMAGRSSANETDDMYGAGQGISPDRAVASTNTRARSPSISSLSSDSSNEAQNISPPTNLSSGTAGQIEQEDERRGRSGLKQRLMNRIKSSKDKPKSEVKSDPRSQPKSKPTTEPTTQVATNTSDDEFEEARDHFEEETLAPPPTVPAVTKTVSPKGSRDRSRFTEEL